MSTVQRVKLVQIGKFFGGPEPGEENLDNLKNEISSLNDRIEGKRFLLCDNVTIADFFVFSDLMQITELYGLELEGDNINSFMNQMKGTGFLMRHSL